MIVVCGVLSVMTFSVHLKLWLYVGNWVTQTKVSWCNYMLTKAVIMQWYIKDNERCCAGYSYD